MWSALNWYIYQPNHVFFFACVIKMKNYNQLLMTFRYICFVVMTLKGQNGVDSMSPLLLEEKIQTMTIDLGISKFCCFWKISISFSWWNLEIWPVQWKKRGTNRQTQNKNQFWKQQQQYTDTKVICISDHLWSILGVPAVASAEILCAAWTVDQKNPQIGFIYDPKVCHFRSSLTCCIQLLKKLCVRLTRHQFADRQG